MYVLYAFQDYEMSTVDLITFGSRCAVLFLFVVSLVLVFVNVARGTRLKNWRLYCVVALVIFTWLALSLYQDHIDEYIVHQIYRFPQRR